MSPSPSFRGFTMIELLVTLVLLGLISAVVAPALDSWLSSRTAAALRTQVAGKLAMLPLQANNQGKMFIIAESNQINIDNNALNIIEPIIVLKNGYCVGGKVAIKLSNRVQQFSVLPPFCSVSLDAAG